MKTLQEVDCKVKELLKAADIDGFMEYLRSLQAEEQTYAIQISERYLAPTIEAPFRAEIAKIRNAGR